MGAITAVDLRILYFLNSFAQHSIGFDSFVVQLSSNVLLEGGLMVAMFWWLWLGDNQNREEKKERLLFGLFLTTFAVSVARLLALSLPFRLRPLHNPALHFKLPYTMDPSTLIGWSSFPSDHAVLFFCLATCLWLVSKRVGTVALAYVYLGIHYPSDMVAGAMIGIAIAFLSEIRPLRDGFVRPILHWQQRHPAPFSAALFIFCFELAEEFSSLRNIAIAGYEHLAVLLQALR